MKGKAYKLDKPYCHVCGFKLKRNMTAGTEVCESVFCQVRNVVFNIPYIVPLTGEKNGR